MGDGGVVLRDDLYGFEVREEDRRRVNAEEKKTYNIKQLWQRSHEIVNLHVLGYKNTEIARILNLTPATVSLTINGTLGKRKVSELRKGRDSEVKLQGEKVRILANKALDFYNDVLENEEGYTTKDKKDVANAVLLELSGLRAPTKSVNFSTVLSREELDEMKQNALKEAEASGEVIDVTPEEE